MYGIYYATKGATDYYTEQIYVTIQDPEHNILYVSKFKDQGLIEFETTMSGEYTFVFANQVGYTEKEIYFGLHVEYPEGMEIEQFGANPVLYDFDENNNRFVKDRAQFEIEDAVATVEEIKKKNEEFLANYDEGDEVVTQDEIHDLRKMLFDVERNLSKVA